MMMTEIEINDIKQLVAEINSLENHYIYRGQANSEWKLCSALERIIGDYWDAEKVKHFEDFSLKSFKPKFHLYNVENYTPSSKLSWLATMQHYGIPTRLLDFSESPYVALYFALESFNYSANNHLALYAINYRSVLDNSIKFITEQDTNFTKKRTEIYGEQDDVFDKFIDPFSHNIIWITEPTLLNTRIDRQAGCFLLSGNRSKKIEEILFSELYKETKIFKFVIPSSLAGGIFALLRKINLTSKQLYGDLDGLARSIRMTMQVYANVNPPENDE